MNGSEALLQALEEEGVRYIFGIPGGANLPLYDAVGRQSIEHIHALHEQGAGHMATGYAKASGEVGVAFATSGPGATNLVTAIADAYMDSAPVVFVTGQVRSDLLGTDAFQEADIIGITLPIVKHSFQVLDASEIPGAVRNAFRIARSGRPGPVLIDIPQDVFRGEVGEAKDDTLRGYRPPGHAHEPSVDRILRALEDAEKPVLYGGGGVVAAGASEEFRQFADRSGIPVTCTLMALGAYPADGPMWMGMLGMHGSRAANWAIDQSDLLLAFGARFDDRITGKLDEFAPGARVVHIDADPAEIHKIVQADIALCADLRDALRALLPRTKRLSCQPWRDQVEEWKAEYPFSYEKSSEWIKPQQLVEVLAEETGGQANISSDVGQHQMWVAQYYPFLRPRQWINSGGSGTMGVGLPYALGAALADPDHQSILVSGDGSLPMTAQELHVASRYQIPVKVFIVANGGYGMVRQWQDLFWDRARTAVSLGNFPDWPLLAASWGVHGKRVADPKELRSAVSETLHYPGPALLEVVCDPEENCYPMIPAGSAARDMIG